MLENELGRPSAGLSGRGLLRLRVAPFARNTTRARWPLPGWSSWLRFKAGAGAGAVAVAARFYIGVRNKSELQERDNWSKTRRFHCSDQKS